MSTSLIMPNMSCADQLPSSNWEILLSSIYGSISIGLYIFLILLILKKPLFHHPFFFQFILLSISNIILWLVIFIQQRIIPHSLFCDNLYPRFAYNSNALKPLLWAYYIPVSIQIFTIIIISLNRLSVIISPMAATQFWANSIPQTISLILLTSFVFSFYVYGWTARIDFVGDSLGVSFVDGWPHIPLAGMTAIISLLCLFVIITSTCIGFYFLYKSNVTRTKIAEVNLFWTNLGLSLATAVLSFYMVMIYIFLYSNVNTEISRNILEFRGWVYDLNCLIPAWLLVATNTQIRATIRSKNPKISVASLA